MANNQDIIGNVLGENPNGQSSQGSDKYIKYLQSIEKLLKEMAKGTSQSAAKDAKADHNVPPSQDPSRWTPKRARSSSSSGPIHFDFESSVNEFEKGLKQSLKDAIITDDVKKNIRASVSAFSKTFGIDIQDALDDIPEALGKQLGDALLKSGPGKALSSIFQSKLDKFRSSVDKFSQDSMKAYDKKHGTSYAQSYQAAKENAQQSAQQAAPSQQSAQQAAQQPSQNAESIHQSVNYPNETSASDSQQSTPTLSTDNISSITVDVINCKCICCADKCEDSIEDQSEDIDSAQITGDNDNNVGNLDIVDAMNGAQTTGESTSNSVTETGLAVIDNPQAAADAASTAANAAGDGAQLAEIATTAGATAEIGPMLAALLPVLAEVLIPILAVVAILKIIEPLLEGIQAMGKALAGAANRSAESRKKNLEEANKRFKADADTLIRKPFELLKTAADNVYSIWDDSLRSITATQGYTKADVQTLLSDYAERLREENLSSVVSSADILSSLTKTLSAGLTGKVGEEFAYLATKLNAAIPTQDFFEYADAYAMIAANAMYAGKSQADAIETANNELQKFADSVLYAGRQISGGFTTGLSSANKLFEDAIKIQLSAKQGEISNIGNVLTAVSAITGAIAPDIADTMVSAVINAALGGNSSENVAIRSLSGVNASNTEFLRAMAQDPKKVFTTMFRTLAQYQNMAPEAFMEVAEGVSSIFGLSTESFARVDFAYLADAIADMNTNGEALNANMGLLVSGQTTTSEEQMKIAQINKYLIDEGLAYVLDNDAARSIQEHMWDEQLAREMQEATYGIEIVGATAQLWEGLKATIDRIFDILTGAWIFKGIANVVTSINDAVQLNEDIVAVLEAGKVGEGNAQALYNLTNRNMDLNLTDPLVEMLGGQSSRGFLGLSVLGILDSLGVKPYTFGIAAGAEALLRQLAKPWGSGHNKSDISSNYNWGMVGKSYAQQTSDIWSYVGNSISSMPASTSQVSQKTTQDDMTERLQSFMETVSTTSAETYEDWVKEAANFGIQDKETLEVTADERGVSLKQLWDEQQQTSKMEEGSKAEDARRKFEESFWTSSLNYHSNWAETYYPTLNSHWNTHHNDIADIKENLYEGDKAWLPTLSYQLADIADKLYGTSEAQLPTISSKLDSIHSTLTKFLDNWIDYYVAHTAYTNSFDMTDVDRISAEDKNSTDSAIMALAEALTQNTVDLKDPAVQTNALLAKIVLLLQAMLNQGGTGGGMSLGDTFTALALGLIENK